MLFYVLIMSQEISTKQIKTSKLICKVSTNKTCSIKNKIWNYGNKKHFKKVHCSLPESVSKSE